MQRYSMGRKVPHIMMERFTGKTTNIFGEVTCRVKYPPKNKNVVLGVDEDVGGNSAHNYWIYDVVGRDVTLAVRETDFQRSQNVTGSTDAAGGGAVGEPHTHAIAWDWIVCDDRISPVYDLPDFTIAYEV